MANLKQANFDPEFFAHFENSINQAFANQLQTA
jgi:hypothetical protein